MTNGRDGRSLRGDRRGGLFFAGAFGFDGGGGVAAEVGGIFGGEALG